MSERRGRFFVLDGGDGCGKSTQAARLVARLEAEGREPLHLREPGSTQLGEALREILLSREQKFGLASEALLFAAARRAMLDELVEPALAAGRDVVCERFHPSTYAYQVVAGGLEEDDVLELLRTWASDPLPDLILILSLDPDEAAGRREGEDDRIEARGSEYARLVVAGYRRYAERDPRAVLVDAGGSLDDVEARINREVARVRA